MDDNDAIDDIIEELTTTGKQNYLNEEHLNKLCSLCRHSPDNLKLTYTLLSKQLEKQHAEIRYSSFQVIDQLFLRSHVFRELVLFSLQDIFVLCMDTSKHRPLPPPSYLKNKLKKFALKKFYFWYKKFGKGYRKLVLGFEYLRDMCKVKFEEMDIQTLAEQEKIKQERKEDYDLRRSKLDQVDMQFEDQKINIDSDIQEMENCFEILVQKVGSGDCSNPSEASANDVTGEPFGNEAGITSYNFSLAVEISTKKIIQETSDNEHIISRLQELFMENRRHENKAKRWLNVLLKCGSSDQGKIQKLQSLKNILTALCSKYLELDIKEAVVSSDDDEGEEFVEVPEKVNDEFIIFHETEESEDKPTCSKCRFPICFEHLNKIF